VRSLRLVVEVLSPFTARFDRFQKRKLYQATGPKHTPVIIDLTVRFAA